MQLHEDKLCILDQALADYLSHHPRFSDRWLFEQTIYTSSLRRTIFQYFPIHPNATLLDAGTGFGVLALELAGQIPLEIYGIDYDQSKLEVAKELWNQLHKLDYFNINSSIQFQNENLYSLSFKESTFDYLISRFVYQHLENPEIVSREIYRVMRPGGMVCIIDIDDQFSISYPEVTPFQKLENAFADLQKKNGGDRHVGRKMASYLHQAGFQIRAVAIQPQAQYSLVHSEDMGSQFVLNRLHGVKLDLVSQNILEESQFNEYINALSQQESMYQFNANAQIIVIAQKPDR